MASSSQSKITLPVSALHELQDLEAIEWSLPAHDIVSWVNEAVARYLPQDESAASGRVSQEFTLRTLRYYQTLGCIDAPQREGRAVHYGFRQYLQALLVRKLLWERMPAERIAQLLKSRSTSEYKEMLLDGIEIIARASGHQERDNKKSAQSAETWVRVSLASGLEIHLCPEVSEIKSSEMKSLLSGFEKAVRTHLLAQKKSKKA
jgi:DNA-binding transcriptional MerR regulator